MNKSLLFDTLSLLLIAGAVFFWVDHRIAAALDSRPAPKVAVLDYSKIQALLNSKQDGEEMMEVIDRQKGQIKKLVERGYIVVDGDAVVASPESYRYTIEPHD